MAQLSRKREQQKYNISTAKVSNQLVEAFVKQNNVVAMKILFYLAKADLKIPNEPLMTLKIDIQNICNYCDIDNKSLRRNIKQMTETSISIKDEKEESFITVIPKATFTIGKNDLEIKMFKEILELVWQVKNKFTLIDVKQLVKLKSKHSIRMLQLLEMFNGYDKEVPKRKHYELEEINLIFGTKYKKIAEFERKILKPVKEELDTSSKLSFVYEIEFKNNPSGRGRPVANSVVIDLVNNKPQGSLF